jgi:hypothetical protein
MRPHPEERRALVLALLVAVLIAFGGAAIARDDGRYAQSTHKDWFDQLKSKGGASCCSDADGFAVSDPDWEAKDGKYRVRLKGQWLDVPEEALITEPNRVGRTMVWPVPEVGGMRIRCFMPGAMT